MTELPLLLSILGFVMVSMIGIVGYFVKRLITTQDEILRQVRLTNGKVIALEAWKNLHSHTSIEQDIRDLRSRSSS